MIKVINESKERVVFSFVFDCVKSFFSVNKELFLTMSETKKKEWKKFNFSY